MKLLLVEDDENTAKLLLRVFGNGGIAVTHSLSEALKALCESSFECIILDLTLLDSKGVETFNRVHEIAPNVPVVVYSGTSNEEDIKYIIHQGAVFLQKSFSKLSDVRDAVDRAIVRAKRSTAIVSDLKHLCHRIRTEHPDE